MADSVAGLPSVTFIKPDAHAAGHEAQHGGRAQEAVDAGRYRLTIEKEASGFVYKTLDRVTGEVVRQLPREEVLKMRESPAYDAGEVIATEV